MTIVFAETEGEEERLDRLLAKATELEHPSIDPEGIETMKGFRMWHNPAQQRQPPPARRGATCQPSPQPHRPLSHPACDSLRVSSHEHRT